MKRFAVLPALLLFFSIAHAQDEPSVSAKRDVSPANREDARMKALEEQVRTLAGEVALLRSELKEFRETKSPEQSSGPQVLLASAHPEPGVLSSSPAPAAAQATQTQTFGGASGNAKLLNPDISLIGDFIGTVGHNNVSPGPSLELHESEIGLQAIIDPYSRADAFLRGASDDLFHASRRRDVSVVGHLRAYRDLSESTNLDLGVSYARGHNSLGSNFLTNLYGGDATIRWRPLRRAIYNSFMFRTELFWSARDQFSPAVPTLLQTQHAFGLYSYAEYRVNRRWTVGGRFDRSGHATDAHLTDSGFSGILTYWPSEFSQIRGQYRFGHLATAPSDFSNANEFLFQFLFVMGAHGAHPF